MTAEELIEHFNKVYDLNPWPKIYNVDHITYANCCQYVFNNAQLVDDGGIEEVRYNIYWLAIGPNNGLMFKNVELILRGE